MNDWKQQQIKEIMEYFGIEHKRPSEIRESEGINQPRRTLNTTHSADAKDTAKRCVCNGQNSSIKGECIMGMYRLKPRLKGIYCKNGLLLWTNVDGNGTTWLNVRDAIVLGGIK